MSVGDGKRPHTDAEQTALPRSRRARRQQGNDVKQWTLSVQKPRGVRPTCGQRRERICDGDIRATPTTQQQGHY
eukprot:14341427-Alexandrium_andersonii.AAC.1